MNDTVTAKPHPDHGKQPQGRIFVPGAFEVVDMKEINSGTWNVAIAFKATEKDPPQDVGWWVLTPDSAEKLANVILECAKGCKVR